MCYGLDCESRTVKAACVCSVMLVDALKVEGSLAQCLGLVRAQTALQSALAAAVPDMLSVQLRMLTALSGGASGVIASFAVATSLPPGTLKTQVLAPCSSSSLSPNLQHTVHMIGNRNPGSNWTCGRARPADRQPESMLCALPMQALQQQMRHRLPAAAAPYMSGSISIATIREAPELAPYAVVSRTLCRVTLFCTVSEGILYKCSITVGLCAGHVPMCCAAATNTQHHVASSVCSLCPRR
jgi:hypothetical protein